MSEHNQHEHDIAVVAVAGRFPGAGDVEAFWRNLRAGVESVTFFSDRELLSFGVDPQSVNAPNFVKASPVLEGADLFDAGFFGYSPREAALLDPQQRLFLEICWEALERAGYEPSGFPGMVGVFGGMSMSGYLLFNLLANPQVSGPEDSLQVMIGTDKDFLSTRVSYHLNLRGPSLDVQTGCSTSLVAVHLACESLLSFQCDLALAGGVSIHVPQRRGYHYQEGGVASPDGHTRAFDARGAGTIFGSGAGVVVLKRMTEALEDGDTILAVLKGSAINNDGSHKIGFTAPGVDGQAEVIARAQAIAGVDPASIRYIEAHGTGTALGDPVEVTALIKAFGETAGRGFCGLGSVKTNIGHLDAAAGVAGLIKTVLALRHRELPPSLNFEEPNPKIDFTESPFYVNAALRPWEPEEGEPLRAGVSSFGIGGTNAHVILEEAPPAEPGDLGREWKLLLLSARSDAALERATEQLAEHLRQHPETDLADAAYTLQVGRRRFPWRRMVLARRAEDAARSLETLEPERVWTGHGEAESRPVIFMFPGGGAQHVDMGRDLYGEEPLFREELDRCADLLAPRLGFDIRDLMFPAPEEAAEAAERIKRVLYGLPALFSVEYALARLWMSWGVSPQAMIGHSLGEYMAACLAGVFTLEEALELVVFRSRLIESIPSGATLSIPLGEEEVRELLRDRAPRVSIAAINGPSQCAVSGPAEAIDELAAELTSAGIELRRVKVSAAAHSPLMDPIVPELERFVAGLTLGEPSIPFISNLSGTWITPQEARDPAYWARHLRQAVRFSDGLRELASEPDRVFLEVGPSSTLTTLARPQLDSRQGQVAVASMPHPYEQVSGDSFLLGSVGKLWVAGVDIDWQGFYAGERRLRVQLPTYPFERQRYWIDPLPASLTAAVHREGKIPEVREWFYVPSWSRRAPARPCPPEALAGSSWLVLSDGALGDALAARLEAQGAGVVRVHAGPDFAQEGPDLYAMDPADPSHYRALLRELTALGRPPGAVAHLWSLSGEEAPGFDAEQARAFYSLLFLAQALAEQDDEGELPLWIVADRLFGIESSDAPLPEKATLLSPAKVVPQELPRVRCRVLDVGRRPAGDSGDVGVLAGRLLDEIAGPGHDAVVGLRGRDRWVQTFEPLRPSLDEDPSWPLKTGGVYLITGGLGGVGMLLARHLAGARRARLALVGRSPLPESADWHVHADACADDTVGSRVRSLLELESLGAEVLYLSADVADPAAMRNAVRRAVERFGRIDGVLHAAGWAGADTVKLLREADTAHCEAHFQAKVRGLYALEEALRSLDQRPDFLLLFSSNVSVLGGLGSIGYTAANLFMDAFAASRAGDLRWLSVNWDGWLMEEGSRLSSSFQTSMDRYAMAPGESIEAFRWVVTSATAPQVVVSTGDLEARLRLWTSSGTAQDEEGEARSATFAAARPALGTAFEAPDGEVESTIATIWQELLGIGEVGVQDNFFDLGGNSLIGLKVISRLNKELGVDLPVSKLFEGPTVRALARVITQDEPETRQIEDSQSRGERRRAARRGRRREAETLEVGT